MANYDQALSKLLRDALDAKVQAWKDELASLQGAPARIADLQDLIAGATADSRASVPIDPPGKSNAGGNGVKGVATS